MILIGRTLITVYYDEISFYKIGIEGLFQSWGFHELFRVNNQPIVRPIFDVNNNTVAELAFDDKNL